MRNVEELMTMRPVCVLPGASLCEVARKMCEFNIGEIPVIKDEESAKLVGVITDRDIVCRCVALELNPAETAAGDCMTSPCYSVNPETSLEEGVALMEKEQIHRLPVVDAEGRCCGILALADIASQLDLEKVGEVLRNISE